MNQVESKIQSIGEDILKRMENQKSSIFRKDYWYGQIMDWSMRNKEFKTQMFRFVDVLPYLNTGDEVTRHLKEYFAESGEDLPSVFNFGLGLGSLAPGLMAGAVRKNITQMAKMFITGETPVETLKILEKQRAAKVSFTIDLLGEASLSEKEGDEYVQRYLDLLETLHQTTRRWPRVDQIDSDNWGEIPNANVSVKLTAICSNIKTSAWEKSKEQVKIKVRPILLKAVEYGIFINFDMESYDVKNLTLEIFKELLMESEFKTYPHFGIVLQAYLRDTATDCQKMIEFAKLRSTPLTVRLVKGAYWDYEVVHAQQNGWPIPVFTNKQESDVSFEKCAELLLTNHKVIKTAIGSHNVRSIAFAINCCEQLGLPKNILEIQMLFGMAEPFKASLVAMGYRIREYATVGDLIPGMAYLVRRLLENTSNESFLKSKFMDNSSAQVLLRSPQLDLKVTSPWIEKEEIKFYNEGILDFAQAESRIKTVEGIEKLKKQLPIEVAPTLLGKKQTSVKAYHSVDPSQPELVLAKVHMATLEQTETAIEICARFQAEWRKFGWVQRAVLLDKLADLILQNRYTLMAVQILEVGKQWSEADADVCEAIDFCRYYAREARRLSQPIKVGHAPGESSLYQFEPRGITAVIAPWNFPLAILTGMVAGALVSGNTVLIKPAEQSSLMSFYLNQYLKEAGFPLESFQFLPGYGEEIGEYMVNHPKVATIAFTGSRDVGLHILRQASVVHAEKGQRFVKRCLIEMGGKNAIIVDNDADLDEVIEAVLYSAFGFQGQKCSACSRVVVHQDIYDRFLARLVEAAKSLIVGPATSAEFDVGPVVDEDSQKRLLQFIEESENQHKLVYKSSVPTHGYFVPVTIFADVDPKSKLAQTELFGPVLAVIKAKSFDHALEIANDVDYGLTGGVFSRSPRHIELAKRDFMVGNLYINRGCTGALVNRHPFGGFKLSGVGSKTGGPDYLQGFCEPRVVIENTMRRGFTPDTL